MGGTHYYIESLLWKVLLDDDPSSLHDDDQLLYERKHRTLDETVSSDQDDDQLLKSLTFDQEMVPQHLTSARLHQLLRKVDPVMADSIHPNNRRKIIR